MTTYIGLSKVAQLHGYSCKHVFSLEAEVQQEDSCLTAAFAGPAPPSTWQLRQHQPSPTSSTL